MGHATPFLQVLHCFGTGTCNNNNKGHCGTSIGLSSQNHSENAIIRTRQHGQVLALFVFIQCAKQGCMGQTQVAGSGSGLGLSSNFGIWRQSRKIGEQELPSATYRAYDMATAQGRNFLIVLEAYGAFHTTKHPESVFKVCLNSCPSCWAAKHVVCWSSVSNTCKLALSGSCMSCCYCYIYQEPSLSRAQATCVTVGWAPELVMFTTWHQAQCLQPAGRYNHLLSPEHSSNLGSGRLDACLCMEALGAACITGVGRGRWLVAGLELTIA